MSLSLISVVPYCDDTFSVNESEPGGAPAPRRSSSSSSKNYQEGGHKCSPFELKSLKRRGQAGGRTASAFHSPTKGEDVFFIRV